MFYLLNKPIWYSSFWVLKILRKKLNVKKIWHTGTLDPLATWLLLVATLNSTKLIPYLEKNEKTYVFSFNIDWESLTWDLEWEVKFFDKALLEEKQKQISKNQIEIILKEKFSGKAKQTPPIFSAIMVEWQRAYDIARKWQDVKLKEREIEISGIKLLDYNFPTISIEATVSAGTYIRVLAQDIWKTLWLSWYVTLLHRSRIWKLDEQLSLKLDDISKENNIDEEILFPEFSKIEVDLETLINIQNWIELEFKDLEENKKYFIVHADKIESLIEIRDSKARIIRNRLS